MIGRVTPGLARALVSTGAIVALAAPAALAVDKPALDRLVADAGRAASQRLIIWQNGKPVLDKRWSGHAEALQPLMHITAPISALAISCLVADGRLDDTETPASRYFPAWKGTPKSEITVTHILWGRTGLSDDGGVDALYGRADMVKHLAARPLDHEVGTHFSHESAVLIGRVVQQAAGEPIDKYLQRRLFTPMGITQTRWRRDKAGNVDTATGLWLKPTDLLRIGELMRLDGRYNGKQLIPAESVQDATLAIGADEDGLMESDQPGEERGDYWRIGQRYVLRGEDLARLTQHRFPNAAKLRPLVDRPYASRLAFVEAAAKLAGNETFRHMNDAESRYGGLPYSLFVGREYGVEASDYLGQLLYVNPATKVVMVRTVPWNGAPVTRSYPQFEFDDLGARVNAVFQGK